MDIKINKFLLLKAAIFTIVLICIGLLVKGLIDKDDVQKFEGIPFLGVSDKTVDSIISKLNNE